MSTRLDLKKIDEISLVDAGDNPHAHVLIHKRAAPAALASAQPAVSTPDRGRLSGIVKRVIAQITGKPIGQVTKDWDEAASFDEVYDRVEWWEVCNEVWDMTSALSDAVSRTLRDTAATDKAALLLTSLEQFTAAFTVAVPTWSTGQTVEKAAPAMCPDCDKPLGADGTCPDCGKTFTKAGRAISAARVARLETVRDGLNELLAEVQPNVEETPMADTVDKGAAPGATTSAPEEDVLKGLPAPAQAAIRKMQDDLTASNAALTAAVAKAEAAEDERVTAVITKRFEKGGDFFGLPNSAELIPALKALKVSSPTEFAVFEKSLLASAEAIRKSGIFKELGAGGEGATDGAWGQLVAKASELRTATPTLSEQQAITKAMDLHPDLVDAYRKETR